MRINIGNFGNKLLVSLAALTLSACVSDGTLLSLDGEIPAPPEGNLISLPEAERIDAVALLDVRFLGDGLVVRSTSLKHILAARGKKPPPDHTYKVGPALRTVVEQGMRKVFKEVVIFDQSTAATGYQGRFDVALRPRLMGITSKLNFNSYTKPVHTGHMRLGISVINKAGQKVGDFVIEAEGVPSPDAPASNRIPSIMQDMLINLRSNIVTKLPKEDAIERWRVQAGVDDPLQQRARAGDVAAAIELGRMHEKTGAFDEAEKWFCMAGEEGIRMSAYQIHCGPH